MEIKDEWVEKAKKISEAWHETPCWCHENTKECIYCGVCSLAKDIAPALKSAHERPDLEAKIIELETLLAIKAKPFEDGCECAECQPARKKIREFVERIKELEAKIKELEEGLKMAKKALRENRCSSCDGSGRTMYHGKDKGECIFCRGSGYSTLVKECLATLAKLENTDGREPTAN